ncbi:MAG TPA: hypothetical protein VJA25_01370 [Dehalococcoidia bacterium]|nr:hypothetical protein [Dehalococcoidia bacterium]
MRRLLWRTVKWILALWVILLTLLFAGKAFAAAPIAVNLPQADIYQNVLEMGDWLVLGRYHLVPEQDDGLDQTDSGAVTTTSGAFDAPLTLINRVVETSAADYTVTADGATNITAYCTLQATYSQLMCTGTGLSDASHTISVAYRGGWGAYAGTDAFFRVIEGSTLVTQRTVPATGYRLVGLYLSAAAVTAASLTWQDATITVELRASPAIWAIPSASSHSISWHTTASVSATESELTIGLRAMLRNLEVSDPAVLTGDYVQSTGITDTGLLVARDAFARISTALPQAFISGSFNPQSDYTTTSTGAFVNSEEAAAAAKLTGQAWQGLSDQLLGGVSGHTFGTVIFGSMALIAAGFVWMKWSAPGLALPVAWAIFAMGWMLGGVPAVYVFLTAALLGGFGLLRLGTEIFGRN